MSEIQSLWQDLVDQLNAQKAQVVEEILSYPPPIPACDAQFNYLLEKRDLLSDELNHLMNLSRDDDSTVSELIQFAVASPFVSKEFEEAILSRLQLNKV